MEQRWLKTPRELACGIAKIGAYGTKTRPTLREETWARQMRKFVSSADQNGQPFIWSDPLCPDGGDFRAVDRHETAVLAAVLELDHAGDLGEEGVVLAAAHVEPGLQLGAALADDDGAAGNGLTAECLDAKPLRVGVAAVFGRT